MDKPIIVHKYGGSSVATIDRIREVAKNIIDYKKKGNHVVVVVSAMGKTTDHLLSLANEVSENPTKRELDMLLSTGEQVSISLLAMMIQSLGEEAISLNGFQMHMKTDSKYSKARIMAIESERILEELEKDKIVILAGFQGVTEKNEITTLGRGGSDTSAVAVAAVLKAKKCQIYTDVDGVYSADPRRVFNAKKMASVSFDEMLEMAANGTKVLHSRSVELAKKYEVALEVCSSFEKGVGTMIRDLNMEEMHLAGLSVEEDIAKVSIIKVPDVPGIIYKITSEIAAAHIPIDMIIQNTNREKYNDISFIIKKEDFNQAMLLIRKLKDEIHAEAVHFDKNIAKLSLIGTGIANHTEITSVFFQSLYELGINVQMISTSQIRISCIIDNVSADHAAQKIHQIFFGSEDKVQ